MPFQTFQDFCISICALAGVDSPALTPDAEGRIAFTITSEGNSIGFVEVDCTDGPGVTMVAGFGPVDEAQELRVLRGLLETNFVVSGIGAPVFVRVPVTGGIALHRSFQLSQIEVQDAYGVLAKTFNAIARWQAGDFFPASTRDAMDLAANCALSSLA